MTASSIEDPTPSSTINGAPGKGNKSRPPAKKVLQELRWLLSLVSPHKISFAIGMFALSFGAAINLVFPEAIRRIISTDNFHIVQERPEQVGIVLGILFLIQAICFYFRTYIFGIIGQKIVNSLRIKLYERVLNQPIDFFDSQRTGELVSRIINDTSLVQDVLSVRLSVLIRYSLQITVGIVLMCVLSLRLSAALILSFPLFMLTSMVLGKRLRAFSKLVQNQLGEATAIANEAFGGIRYVRASGAEPSELDRFIGASNEILVTSQKRAAVSAWFQSFASFLLNIIILGVIIFGVVLVQSSLLPVSDLTAFLLYGVIVATSFGFVISGVTDLFQAAGALERVRTLLSSASEPVTGGENHVNSIDSIKFQDVCFSYSARSEQLVLRDINFALIRGKKIALVGPSGAGKSTIAALLLKLYSPTSGEILINEDRLDTLSRVDYLSKTAFVPQDPHLFSMSIAENLSFGVERHSTEELYRALESVGMLSFVKSLPLGLQTPCGERGVSLSGGQRQRLAIARALLRKPHLLILDEPTAALDAQNEALVQESLDSIGSECACLIIAHRLATVKKADQILVLLNGQIVDSGTHLELSSRPGLYQQMVAKQELYTAR